MVICDITQAYNPTSGGVRTYIHEKQKYINDNTSYRHILIIPGLEDSVTKQGQLTTYTVAAPAVPGVGPYHFMWRLDKIQAILNECKPDVIEVGSPYILPWVAFYYARQNFCLISGFYHTDYPTAYVKTYVSQKLAEPFGKVAEAIAKFYAKTIYRQCDTTITASPLFKKKLAKFKLPNLQYIPLGVDLNVFNPKFRDESLRAKFGVPKDGILFFYAGRMDSEKQIDLVVQAFSELPQDFPGRFAMTGEGPLREKLIEIAKKDKRIHVLPYEHNRERLATLLASADVYATAAAHETFGLSIIEAQASGNAVIGVNSGALPERVVEGTGLIGRVNSKTDMLANMQKIAQMDFRSMGQKARQIVQEQFSWENTFSKLLKTYEATYALKVGQTSERRFSETILAEY